MVNEAVQQCLDRLCNMGIEHAGAHFTGALYRDIIEFMQNRHTIIFPDFLSTGSLDLVRMELQR